MGWRRVPWTLATVAALGLAACAGDPAPSTSVSSASASPAASSSVASSSAPAAGWPTYHRTNDRAGAAQGIPATRTLRPGWRAALDGGAVYGQPLVVGDLVIAVTERDGVYALGLADGRVHWHTSVGTPASRSELPCGDIDPLGITGTPAYDSTTGSVFVAAETTGGRHDLIALDAVTGAVRWRASLDVLPHRDRLAEQQRGALAVANGRVYVPFGGLAGDCGNYVGYVTTTPVTGPATGSAAGTTAYQVPTGREGGIWAPSGVAVDSGGDVWVAVGNGESTSEPYDGSDSVLRLAPDLSRRLDYFAPVSWGSENASDADLGSTGPLLLDGTPGGRVAVSGKTGAVYLLDGAKLGGIGGQISQVSGCRGFGGSAWDAERRALFIPCAEGLLRVDVAGRALSTRWRASSSLVGSPVVGGGAVFVLDPTAGRLSALDEQTGHALATADVGATNRFASPVVVGSRVLVPTLGGVTCVTIG